MKGHVLAEGRDAKKTVLRLGSWLRETLGFSLPV